MRKKKRRNFPCAMGDCHLLIYHWKRRRIAHRRGSLAGNLMLLLCWMLKSDKLWMCETEGEKLQSKLSQLIKFQDNYCIVSCWLCFISATAVAQKRHSSLIFFLLRRFCKEKRACSFLYAPHHFATWALKSGGMTSLWAHCFLGTSQAHCWYCWCC